MSVQMTPNLQAYMRAKATGNEAEAAQLKNKLSADELSVADSIFAGAKIGATQSSGDTVKVQNKPLAQGLNADTTLTATDDAEQQMNQLMELLVNSDWKSPEDVKKEFPGIDDKTANQLYKSNQEVKKRLDNHTAVKTISTEDDYKKLKAEAEAAAKRGEGEYVKDGNKFDKDKFEKENKYLNKNDMGDMVKRATAAQEAIRKAKEDLDAHPDDALIKENYEKVLGENKMLADAVDTSDPANPKINVDAYKAYWRGEAGADLRLNLDERENKYSKKQAKAAGLDAETDHTWLKRIGVGLGVAGLSFLSMGLIKGKGHASASKDYISGGSTTNVNGHITSTPSTVGTLSVAADAIAKIPVVGQILGSLGAGTLAAIAAGKDTGSPDIFKGHSCAEVLADPSLVKGKENQQIVRQIADLKIPQAQKEVLLMVATAKSAEGGKANKDELFAALQMGKYLEKNPVQEPDPDPVTPDPVTPDPGPEPDPEPVTTYTGARGRAVDEGLKSKYGITEDAGWDINNQVEPAKAQYVSANENGEVVINGDPNLVAGKDYDPRKPETITFNDNTNGNINTYTYRRVTPEEIAAGKLEDGTPIKTGGKTENLYVLVSADKDDGTDIKSTHTEIYELQYQEDEREDSDTGNKEITSHYNLRQYEGMSGYNVSSNNYSQRGVGGKRGNTFNWGNWTKQTPERQEILKGYGCTDATELINNLVPRPNLDDLIKANPSVFTSDGKVKPDAKWDKLDLPKGTRIKSPNGTLVRDNQPIQAQQSGPAPLAGLNPEQQALVDSGIPVEVIQQGDEAVKQYAQEHNIQLPQE